MHSVFEWMDSLCSGWTARLYFMFGLSRQALSTDRTKEDGWYVAEFEKDWELLFLSMEFLFTGFYMKWCERLLWMDSIFGLGSLATRLGWDTWLGAGTMFAWTNWAKSPNSPFFAKLLFFRGKEAIPFSSDHGGRSRLPLPLANTWETIIAVYQCR